MLLHNYSATNGTLLWKNKIIVGKKFFPSWADIISQLIFFIFGNFCKNIRHKYTLILIILVVKLQNLSNSRTSLKPNWKRLKAIWAVETLNTISFLRKSRINLHYFLLKVILKHRTALQLTSVGINRRNARLQNACYLLIITDTQADDSQDS